MRPIVCHMLTPKNKNLHVSCFVQMRVLIIFSYFCEFLIKREAKNKKKEPKQTSTLRQTAEVYKYIQFVIKLIIQLFVIT